MRVDAATFRSGRAGRGLRVTATPSPGITKRARIGMNRTSCRGERPASTTRPNSGYFGMPARSPCSTTKPGSTTEKLFISYTCTIKDAGVDIGASGNRRLGGTGGRHGYGRKATVVQSVWLGLYFYRVPSPPATDDGSATPVVEDSSTAGTSAAIRVNGADAGSGPAGAGTAPGVTEAAPAPQPNGAAAAPQAAEKTPTVAPWCQPCPMCSCPMHIPTRGPIS